MDRLPSGFFHITGAWAGGCFLMQFISEREVGQFLGQIVLIESAQIHQTCFSLDSSVLNDELSFSHTF
jgi:hypothetical protein